MKKFLLILCSFLPLWVFSQWTNDFSRGIYFYDNCEGTEPTEYYDGWGIDPRTTWTAMASGSLSAPGNPRRPRMFRVSQGQNPDGNGTGAPVARAGTKMYKAVVYEPNSADYSAGGGSVPNDRIRSEGYWSHGSDSRVSDYKWSAVSLWIPSETCTNQGPIGIAFDSKFSSASGPPSFYVMMRNGRLVVKRKACEGSCPEVETDIGPLPKGRWVDFALNRNFTDQSSGYIRFYVDGQLVYSYNGANFQMDQGPSTIGYQITGLYIWGWQDQNNNEVMNCNGPFYIYYDEYKFGNSSATLQTMSPSTGTPNPTNPDRLLVFSKTAAFRHTSITPGIAAIQQMGVTGNFSVKATEDASIFRLDSLQKFKAVVFLNTTGDILNGTQQTAMEQYIQNGGGFAGIHAAFDTEYGWPWYGNMIGVWFSDHPAEQTAIVRKLNGTHPASSTLPATWQRFDEWYNFGTWNRTSNIFYLFKVDETTYSGGTEGDPHPISWYGPYDGGRVFMTAMGHGDAMYTEANFLTHLYGGIQYAMTGAAGATNQPPTVSAGPDKAITAPTTTTNFVGTASDPDGSIQIYAWTKVSGPAGGTISTPATANTNITALDVGTYVFRLTVTDNLGATAFDNVSVVVSASAPVGNPPSVFAGNNQVINTTTVSLGGSATVTNGTKIVAWTKETGTGGTITSANQYNTLVTGLVNGQSYRFKLTVTDSADLVGNDTVNVTVSIPTPNQPPVVSAGANQTITLPRDSVTLVGTASDPESGPLVYTWTQIQGPEQNGGVATIVTPTLSTTKIRSLIQGTYIFRLVARDDANATSNSDVQVTVQPLVVPNQPPVVNIQPQSVNITLPLDSVLISGNCYDQDAGGYIASAAWTYIGGPKTPTVVNRALFSTTKQAMITGLDSAGVYVFQLNVYDNNNAFASGQMTVNVSAAPPIPEVNNPPTISAPNKVVYYPNVFTFLQAIVTDDHDSSGHVAVIWRQVAGPGAATFVDTTKSSMGVTFSMAGEYTFRVTATDSGGATSMQQMVVQVSGPKRKEKYLLRFLSSF